MQVRNTPIVYEYDQVRCGGVEGYHAQRNARHLVETRNTTQQLHNAKRCALEHCVGSHISWQVVYIGDRSSFLQ